MSKHRFPIVRKLPADFSLPVAFGAVAKLPGCLWLDTASLGPLVPRIPNNRRRTAPDSQRLGRYSFLTADPIDRCIASVGERSPWPQLDAWSRSLPRDRQLGLPPFQGGIAGLIGYESATWLEPVLAAAVDDLPTPAMSVGLYDWTIATDHQRDQSWIISQGFRSGDAFGHRESDRYRRATQRIEQVEAWLADSSDRPVTESSGNGEDFWDDIQKRYVKTRRPGVWSNFTGDQYRSAVADIVGRIGRGDSFQVNLAQRLLVKANRSSPELYLRLRHSNPAPYGGYYGGTDHRGNTFEVLSSSPEGFLQIRDGVVQTRPIKGTVPRTGQESEDLRLAKQLLQSEKDRAENTMIVDLMRNDLSRVCSDESVDVAQLCGLEQYEYVQHLVSVVHGKLRPDTTAFDVLSACFPGGSVTGAPKIEAMRTIAQLEPHCRGPYCGSLGYISCGGDADFNILIRTVTAVGGCWQIPVGGGVTARSEPELEEAETWTKSEGMLRAILDLANLEQS